MDKITSICVGLKYIIGLFYAFYLHPISTNPQYLWPAKLAVYSCGVKRKNERTRAEYSYTNTGQMEVDVLQDEAARFFFPIPLVAVGSRNTVFQGHRPPEQRTLRLDDHLMFVSTQQSNVAIKNHPFSSMISMISPLDPIRTSIEFRRFFLIAAQRPFLLKHGRRISRLGAGHRVCRAGAVWGPDVFSALLVGG